VSFNDKRCYNCRIEIGWGKVCVDCFRAMLVAFAGGIATALIAAWFRK
jgi:hypothetical protein